MDLYGWLLNNSSSSSEPVIPTQLVASSSREPPDFLKPRKTAPPKSTPTGGTPDSDSGPVVTAESFPLTPLESRLKEIVLGVYSDKVKPLRSESHHTKASPSKWIVSGTGAVSADSGALGLRDLSTGVSPSQGVRSSDSTVGQNPLQEAIPQRPDSVRGPSVSEKYLHDRSTPDGEEFPDALNSDPPRQLKVLSTPGASIPSSKSHTVSRVLSSSLGPSCCTIS